MSLVIVCIALLSNVVSAQPTATPQALVQVAARVDKNEVTIGDPIRYTIEINAPEKLRVIVPVYSDAIGTFQITDFGDAPTRNENGRVTITRWYTLAAFETGDKLIPPPQVNYVPEGQEPQEAKGNEIKVTVISLLAKQPAATDIRDLKPVEELPFDWQPVWLGAGALAVLLLIAGAFYYVLNRPRRAYVAPPIPPHEVALSALSKLRGRGYIEAGRFDSFYVELSSIARKYLEDRFHLRAPEMTTEEFLITAGRDSRLNAGQRRLLSDFLAQADLVKFARALPTLSDSEAAYEAARRFVEETKPASNTVESNRAAA